MYIFLGIGFYRLVVGAAYSRACLKRFVVGASGIWRKSGKATMAAFENKGFHVACMSRS